MQVNVNSEVGILRSVLVGPIENFVLHPPINITQRYYYQSAPPDISVLIKQHEAFIGVLKSHNVKVYHVDYQSYSPNQVNVRDVATVIGTNFVICSMKSPLRQNEPIALKGLIGEIENRIFHAGAGVLEGGDIILDRNTLYVGLGERTDKMGLSWLEQNFSKYFEIVPIYLKAPFLHLDVVFNLVGDNAALVYPSAINDSSFNILRERYKFIEVTKEEQFDLATNVLSLSSRAIISNIKHFRLNNIIRDTGIEVIELDYSEITKIGGSFRCGTCPLIRDSLPDL